MSSPDLHRPPQVRLRLGTSRAISGSGGTHLHVNAATGEVQAEIPLAGAQEMNRAIDMAADAFEIWRRWPPTKRRDALVRLARLIELHGEEFGRLAALDNGTPLAVGARGWEIAKAWVSYYAGWADKLEGAVTSSFVHGSDFSYSVAEPYGVIGIIITWNGPLISLGMKVAPALAAGNTVVVKPSELTPFAADLFSRLVLDAGIPEGVCTILPGGLEAGQALVSHPKVEKISFTGGPRSAQHILAACAPLMKPALLELGGKSANMVFPDADLDAAAQYAALWGVGLLSGQGCALPTRLLVHASIYDDMLARVVDSVSKLVMGDPFAPTTMMGPVINEAALTRILSMVARAKANHAGRLVLGGTRAGGALAKGFYVEPTVFAEVNPSSEIAQQEVFGPVLSVMRFHTEEEAVRIANGTSYGLAAYIQTRDVTRVHRLAAELKAGGVYVNSGKSIEPNTPFGGIGISGYGREGGRPGIEEFVRFKSVAIGRGREIP